MRKRKKWSIFAVTLVSASLAATVLMADLTGITVTTPVIIGGPISWDWTDDGNPQLTGANILWTWSCDNCASCAQAMDWGPTHASGGSVISR